MVDEENSASPVKVGEYLSPEILVFTYQTTQAYIPLQRTVSREICITMAGIKLDT
jgi:hypothetical protein